MDVPVLWHFAISHFTEKARWALDWKGIPHERRMLFLDYPIRCGLRTGQLRLPVLFDGGRAIRESSAIIAHLEERQPEPALYPGDEAERARALDRLEHEIGPSGYLAGDRFSVADLTTAALFYPVAMPPEYPFTFPPVYAEAVAPLLERVEGRDAQKWVREIYRRYRGSSAAIRG